MWLYYIIDQVEIVAKKTLKITDKESDYLYITMTLISQLSSSEIESSPSSVE